MTKKLLSLLLVLVAALTALTSCGLLFGDVAEKGDVTVVIENEDGTFAEYGILLSEVENKSEGAKGIVEHLNKSGRLELEMIDSTYGAYVGAIGGISENPAEGVYVMVYTSLASDSYEGASTVEYDGKILHRSGVGLSGMTVNEGSIILFRLEKSPY